MIGEAFLDYAVGKDPDIVDRLGVILKQGFGMTMIPTIALPAIEVMMNRSLHFGTPIESPSMRTQLPTEFQTKTYTSETARKLSSALARFAETADAAGLGRTGRFIEKMTLSPAQYDHLVRGYFGTLGYDLFRDAPEVIRGGRNLARAIAGKEALPSGPKVTSWRNHFFVRGFTLDFPTGSARSLRRFYDRREVLNNIASQMVRLQQVADTDDIEGSPADDRALAYAENHMEELMLAPLVEQVASTLATLSTQKAHATSYDQVEAINRDALKQAQDALEMLGKLSPAEAEMMQQRLRESQFLREENRPLQDARNQIDLIVQRRQLQGIEMPTDQETEQVRAIIRAIPGLTGGQRSSLSRYYRNIRKGSLVDREFGKTSRRVRRRAYQSQREP
jgi:hypothetical protein